MNLSSLSRKHVTWQHEVMLPAVQAADASIRPLVSSQPCRIALAPYGAFVKRRLELAMASQNSTFPPDEQQRAIDRSAGAGVPLDHTDHDIDAGHFGGGAKFIGGRARNIDSAGEILRHGLPGERLHLGEGKERIARQPGFAEGCDGGSHRASLLDEAAGLLRRSLAIKHDWCRLDRGKLEMSVASHGLHLRNSSNEFSTLTSSQAHENG